MNAQLIPSWSGGLAQFRSSYAETEVAITVVTDIEAGNVDAAKVTITNATSASPIVYADTRSHASVVTWRHFLFAVENAAGKTPIFQFNRATKYDPSVTPATGFKPYWTQDFITWTQAPARTLVGGSSGYIEWQFTDPLPAGRVYIASHPLGRLTEVNAYAANLLTTYPTIWAPTPSANASGVYFTSPAETDDLGRQVGGNPMHALKASWPGPTTDGGPKRKLVMMSGIHAAGEQPSWIMGRYALEWMMLDASVEAQNFRKNFDIYWYAALMPNSIVGGSYRKPFRSTQDPNRDWYLDSATSVLAEITATANAIVADTGGTADAVITWHGFGNMSGKFIAGLYVDDPLAPSPAPDALFESVGETIFGEAAQMLPSNTTGTDCWWGKAKLGAKISYGAELGQNGDNSLATIQQIGESWAKTLQAVDAQALFYTPPASTHTLVVANSTQAQTSPSVAVTQTASLARPTSDVSAGSWTPSTGTSLAGVLDETTASDTDYITASGTTPCTLALNPVTTPGAGTTKTVKVRAWSPTNGSVTVELLQNTTVIASWTQALTTSATTYSFNLTSTQAGNITDYSVLRVRLTAA